MMKWSLLSSVSGPLSSDQKVDGAFAYTVAGTTALKVMGSDW